MKQTIKSLRDENLMLQVSAAEIGDTCRENGLLVSAEEDVLMLFPALNITPATAQRGMDIFERSL